MEKYEFHLLLPTGATQTTREQRPSLKGETLGEVTGEIESGGHFNIQRDYSDNIIPPRGMKEHRENWAKLVGGKEGVGRRNRQLPQKVDREREPRDGKTDWRWGEKQTEPSWRVFWASGPGSELQEGVPVKGTRLNCVGMD